MTTGNGENGELTGMTYEVVVALRVLMIEEDGIWYAQGLEVDYAAEGDSLDDAKHRFARGLEATIEQHLMTYGSVEKLIRQAPAEFWHRYLSEPTKWRLSGRGVLHAAPWQNVGFNYYQRSDNPRVAGSFADLALV